MTNLILNRVNYHAPINYDGDIPYKEIIKKGIDLSLPVFIMKKPLIKALETAFKKAKNQKEFNLILTNKNRRLLKLKNCFCVEDVEKLSLEKLDVNYKTNSKYVLVEKGDYVKVGEKLDFKHDDFCNIAKTTNNDVLILSKQFILNGENIIIELVNTKKENKVVEIEVNRELKKGCYSFSKNRNSLKIQNLFTNENLFFNFNFGKIKERFSCLDGVENCNFSRVNFQGKIQLKPFEKKVVFLNFGKDKIILSDRKEIEGFFQHSKTSLQKIFNVKIESENKFFERFFNEVLPCKIWNTWLKGERDLKSENEYLKIKENVILKKNRNMIFPKNKYNILKVFLFENNKFKKIDNYTQISGKTVV